MTPKTLKKVANFYIKFFKTKKIEPIRGDGALELAHWCCEHVLMLVGDDELERAHQHIGFIQGILYAKGLFTPKELNAHNESAKDGPIDIDRIKLVNKKLIRSVVIPGTEEAWRNGKYSPLVINEDFELLDGYGRYGALKALGIKQVNVIVINNPRSL